ENELMAPYTLSDVALILRVGDDVATALRPILEGDELRHERGVLTARQYIAPGHKIALRAREEGAPIRKYGQIIGFATQAVAAGEHVHTHNCAVREYEREYAIGSEVRRVDFVPEEQRRNLDCYLPPCGGV